MRKINLLIAAPLAILLLLSFGCSKNQPVEIQKADLELALDDILAEDLAEDVIEQAYEVIFDESDYGVFKSDDDPGWPECRVRTVELPEEGEWPRVVTIDYGEDGCQGRWGKVRTGKIIVTVYGKYKEEGSYRNITFENYTVDGNLIEGNKTLTNIGRNEETGNLIFTDAMENGKITRADSVVIERSWEKLREWIAGEDTRTSWDNEWLVNGSVQLVNKDGVGITRTITSLHRARFCQWPLSGIIEIVKENSDVVTVLDYGEGECDKFATLTRGDDVWIINLKSNERKRVEEGEKDEE